MMDFEGWLVGSAVPWFEGMTDDKPKDYDVIIPPHRWPEAMRSLADVEYEVNSFGGLKFKTGSDVIDVWPDSLGGYFRMGGTKTPIYALSLDPRVTVINNEE